MQGCGTQDENLSLPRKPTIRKNEGQQRMKVVRRLSLWKYSVFKKKWRRGCVLREKEGTSNFGGW
jgi:hypothetical protein